MWKRVVARLAIASVWLYNGLWCKLLAGCPGHREIIAAAANGLGLPPLAIGLSIGAAEVLIAVWVLSGRQPRLAAWVQTAIVVAMNLAGLLFGGHTIAEPAGLLVHNFVFLTLVWLATPEAKTRGHGH